MSTKQPDKSQIFGDAADLKDPAERAAYLDEACGEDRQLRAEIEELLEHDEQASSFLKAPLPGLAATVDACPITEGPGTLIGHYKLLQEIGEGGMGTVFMAEQIKPVQRRVALKIIKQGMDTRQFIARFEAERQALAMMDHPNIARVLDAGCTDSGRPYFVMELVKGLPITRFCDENRLTASERLRLFVSVCQAVQHAHQKGIIHRDLKPSNVLVALYDDLPVPKIIDFGVAKATSQKLTEKTLFTQIGQIVGTWEYMSPEQAVLNQLDVDTRSDIYSLGVILYELLTGVPPVESDRLRSGALEETLRIIREEEPPKPSTRVSSLGEKGTATATYRGTTAPSLAKTLRGDLDWIVMKALEKSRSRRYETASDFAADVNRYLNGEPIEARPPSTTYRLRKAASRHRVALATTAVVALTLLAATVTSVCLAARAIREERRARAVLAELWEELADRAMDAAFSGDLPQAQEAIQKAELAEAPDDLLKTLRGLALFFDGKNDKAIAELEKASADNPNSLSALSALWWAHCDAADPDGMYQIEKLLKGRKWTPKADYERLFLCLTQAATGSPETIEEVIGRLEGLVQKRSRWGVAYAILAMAKRERGLESMKLEDFRQTIADFRKAESILRDSPFVLTIGLQVLTDAIQLAELQGCAADAKEWRKQAEEIADRLDKRPDHLDGREEVAAFCYNTGQLARGKKVEDELVTRGDGGLLVTAAVWLRDRQTTDLESSLRAEGEKTDPMISLAFILGQKSQEGRKEAMRIFNTIQEQDVYPCLKVIALDIPLLQGKPDVAGETGQRLLTSDLLSKEWRWWKYVTAYHAGKMGEDELLRRAGPFSSHQCMANYGIATKALSIGNRKKAREYFRKTIATGRVGWWNYHAAQAFLQRMEEDPKWPN